MSGPTHVNLVTDAFVTEFYLIYTLEYLGVPVHKPMEVDDFVETSDVEELQELEEEGKRTRLLSSQHSHDSFNSYSPSKRVKVRPRLSVSIHFFQFTFPSKLYHGTPPPAEAPELPEVNQEELLDAPRYSLRRRNAAQLKPYTVDQLKYKHALRENPDAIVKFKNLALRNHHYHPEDRYEEDRYEEDREMDDEGQAIYDLDLDEGNHRHSLSKQSDLSDISDTDIQPFRSKQRALARILPKSMAFALAKRAATSSTTTKHRRSSSSTPLASGSDDDDDEGPLLPGHTRTRKATNLRNLRVIKGDSESEQEVGDDLDTGGLALQTDDEADLEDEENHRHSQTKKPDSSEISDIEIDLSRSERRVLGRMLPKSMILALVKQAAASSTATKRRRTSTPLASGSDDNDEGPLLPGHTRTRKATNLRDIRDIKGDSESEQEVGDDSDTGKSTLEATAHSQPSGASTRFSPDKVGEDNYVLDNLKVKDHLKMSWKEREKARRARAKKQGLYTFASKGPRTHIEGGRRETAFITVDLQDEGFHYALAPQQDRVQTQNWATMFKPIPEPSLAARSRDKTNNGDEGLTVRMAIFAK